MIERQYINALRKIHMRLSDHQINWVITGSLGMALQGMDIEVHDIDIQTNRHGAYEIEGVLSEYIVRPVHDSTSERMRSHFGALEVDGIKVEIMGDVQKLLDGQVWEEPVSIEEHRHWADFEGMHIPVLSLEYEYQAYRKLGRGEKADRIEKWLREQRPK